MTTNLIACLESPIAESTAQCLLGSPGGCPMVRSGRLCTHRAIRFNQQVLVDTTPLPDSIPKVREVGASSAPLLSASFFIGARGRAYNDDYMVCKTQANGTGEVDCLKEGRKVTRCAASVYVVLAPSQAAHALM